MRAFILILALLPMVGCGMLMGEPGIVQEEAQGQLWNAIELSTPAVTEGLGEVADPFRTAVEANDVLAAVTSWPTAEAAAQARVDQRLADGEIGDLVALSLLENIQKLSEAVGSLK